MLYLDCLLRCQVCGEPIAPGDPVVQVEKFQHAECYDAGTTPELVPAFWGEIY